MLFSAHGVASGELKQKSRSLAKRGSAGAARPLQKKSAPSSSFRASAACGQPPWSACPERADQSASRSSGVVKKRNTRGTIQQRPRDRSRNPSRGDQIRTTQKAFRDRVRISAIHLRRRARGFGALWGFRL